MFCFYFLPFFLKVAYTADFSVAVHVTHRHVVSRIHIHLHPRPSSPHDIGLHHIT
jgi:hypothetical protein